MKVPKDKTVFRERLKLRYLEYLEYKDLAELFLIAG